MFNKNMYSHRSEFGTISFVGCNSALTTVQQYDFKTVFHREYQIKLPFKQVITM